eukprot:CAMPEP_0197520232 /NCGR_PEP_ID=MMETSP1318-20131121/5559_1 /TAXON_ID=552666 /ORGANISM="Partenskyella glossopodia, Strain RCC365" /LENGTH=113 /DNA_ID=CAMNT_0043071677 /DNA_START=80 /DNA_END=421 /DNA_ORIENTATION=-
MGNSKSQPTALGGGSGPTASRMGTDDEERRKRAEAMEKKLAKTKRHKSKATKKKENWETYKKLDKAAKNKQQSQRTIENGVLRAGAGGSSSSRSAGRNKEDIGPQSAIFQTRA